MHETGEILALLSHGEKKFNLPLLTLAAFNTLLQQLNMCSSRSRSNFLNEEMGILHIALGN